MCLVAAVHLNMEYRITISQAIGGIGGTKVLLNIEDTVTIIQVFQKKLGNQDQELIVQAIHRIGIDNEANSTTRRDDTMSLVGGKNTRVI